MCEALRWIPQSIFNMPTRILVATVVLVSACFIPPEEYDLGSGLDAGPRSGGGAGGGTGSGAGFQRCVELVFNNESLCTTVFPVICSGQTCRSDEVCCQTTGACTTPGSAACPNPPTSYPYTNAKACGASSDCKSDEFCAPDDQTRCVAASGHCVAMNNCGFCGTSPGSTVCEVCGCDGRTYATMQAACVAGVNSMHGSCGVPTGFTGPPSDISCGTSDQCPRGAACCFRTGKCFVESEPWRCEPQPDGSLLNCSTDAECNRGTGGSGGTSDAFCGRPGCGAGPGQCTARGSASSCGGEVKTVCGCDGTTYVNACWARVGGARVAYDGGCP